MWGGRTYASNEDQMQKKKKSGGENGLIMEECGQQAKWYYRVGGGCGQAKWIMIVAFLT